MNIGKVGKKFHQRLRIRRWQPMAVLAIILVPPVTYKNGVKCSNQALDVTGTREASTIASIII